MNWDDLPIFKSERFAQICEDLATIRKAGHQVLPRKENILNAFALTPLDTVRVVILGQDPYPNYEHAMGLSFSVPAGTHPLPKSLANIFAELKSDLGIVRTNGDLTDWAQQGVLLLNTHLTVLAGQPGSHANLGWSAVTNQAIRVISEFCDTVVFILWGNHAAGKIHLIDEEKHNILISAHPSPLSAHRGFFGSKPFSKTNAYLVSHGKETIVW